VCEAPRRKKERALPDGQMPQKKGGRPESTESDHFCIRFSGERRGRESVKERGKERRHSEPTKRKIDDERDLKKEEKMFEI